MDAMLDTVKLVVHKIIEKVIINAKFKIWTSHFFIIYDLDSLINFIIFK